MYCGNCLRDNALVAELRRLGHQVTLLPLYLPLTLDEEDQSAGNRIFFGGINVYLEQQSAWFRQAPAWLHGMLDRPGLLKWAAGRAAKTRPAEVGELTLSMLRGEAGNQARELTELTAWLKTQPRIDVITLSNALLVGMARRLKAELGAPIVFALQGEDSFLDALPEPHREPCWRAVAERAADVDLFVTPSRYFGELMTRRLGLPPGKVRVVPNGISLTGYDEPVDPAPGAAPILGFFARMCREKGLDTLIEAYIGIRERGRVKGLKLRVGGSCGPADEPVVNKLRERLQAAGLADEVEFCPNLSRAQKIAFLKSLSVFSVPARYGEAFGLYVLEALGAGVPVVQPRTAAFPELMEATGGGVLCEPGNAEALGLAIEELLLDPERRTQLGRAGRAAVIAQFSSQSMAQRMEKVYRELMELPKARLSRPER